MPSQKKMKAIREQKARQSAFYKAKREANPDSKDYKKPGAKKKATGKKATLSAKEHRSMYKTFMEVRGEPQATSDELKRLEKIRARKVNKTKGSGTRSTTKFANPRGPTGFAGGSGLGGPGSRKLKL